MNAYEEDEQLVQAVVAGDLTRSDARIAERIRVRPEFAERLELALEMDEAMWNVAGRFHQVRALADDPRPSTAADDAAMAYAALLEASGGTPRAPAATPERPRRRRRSWRIGLLLAASMAIAVGLTLAIESMTSGSRGGAVDVRLGQEYRMEREAASVRFDAPPAPKHGGYRLRILSDAGEVLWESETQATLDPFALDPDGQAAWQSGRLAQVLVLRADGRVHDQSPRLSID